MLKWLPPLLDASIRGLRRRHARVVVGRTLLTFIAMVACDVMAAAAIQDARDQPASATAGENANELAELGETLKAAVLSGTLSRADAIGIYKTMASRLATGPTKGKARDSTGPYASKLDVIMLSAPRPEQISALFRPSSCDAISQCWATNSISIEIR